MRRFSRVTTHIGVLERRAEYLARRVADPALRESARAFEAREKVAVEEAIAALRLAKLVAEPATDPFSALAELVDVFDDVGPTDLRAAFGETTDRVVEAVARGRAVLAIAEADG